MTAGPVGSHPQGPPSFPPLPPFFLPSHASENPTADPKERAESTHKYCRRPFFIIEVAFSVAITLL